MSDIDWRERWEKAEAHEFQYEDIAGRQVGGPFAEYDTLGRKKPRRLGIPSYLLLIARLDPARVRRVPASAIDDEGTDETSDFSFVRCPCGHRPVARPRLEKCPGCERHYVHIELGAVYVAYGEMSPPSLPPSLPAISSS